MRIVVSEPELRELGVKSVVLTTNGITWTKLDRSPSAHNREGWYTFGHDPRTSKELAEGKPILVLLDTNDPLGALEVVQDRALSAQRFEDVNEESWAADVPYYDFAVCWNSHHPDTERFHLA